MTMTQETSTTPTVGTLATRDQMREAPTGARVRQPSINTVWIKQDDSCWALHDQQEEGHRQLDIIHVDSDMVWVSWTGAPADAIASLPRLRVNDPSNMDEYQALFAEDPDRTYPFIDDGSYYAVVWLEGDDVPDFAYESSHTIDGWPDLRIYQWNVTPGDCTVVENEGPESITGIEIGGPVQSRADLDRAPVGSVINYANQPADWTKLDTGNWRYGNAEVNSRGVESSGFSLPETRCTWVRWGAEPEPPTIGSRVTQEQIEAAPVGSQMQVNDGSGWIWTKVQENGWVSNQPPAQDDEPCGDRTGWVHRLLDWLRWGPGEPEMGTVPTIEDMDRAPVGSSVEYTGPNKTRSEQVFWTKTEGGWNCSSESSPNNQRPNMLALMEMRWHSWGERIPSPVVGEPVANHQQMHDAPVGSAVRSAVFTYTKAENGDWLHPGQTTGIQPEGFSLRGGSDQPLLHWATVIEPEPDGSEQTLLQQVAEYTDRIAALQAELDQARRAHAEDVQNLASSLTQEAVDRGWCGEYERVVSRINEDMTIPLPDRAQEDFVIEVPVKVTYEFTYRTTRSDVGALAHSEIARRAMREAEGSAWRHSDFSDFLDGAALAVEFDADDAEVEVAD